MWGGNEGCEVFIEWILLRKRREKKNNRFGVAFEFELVGYLKIVVY